MRTSERTAIAAGQRVSVRVPATSANLGPGFDSLGLAVTLYDHVQVESTDDGVFSAEVAGEGSAELPRDGSHLILATIRDTLGRVGYESTGLRLQAENVIPHGRGLGSSAAAIVSAVLLANALLPAGDRLSDQEVLQLCSAQEGHPDNVAPALAGRLAISWETGGSFFSTAVDVHPDIVPIVAIPSYELSTETARNLLPVSVPHHVAAANAGRAALLVQALTRDPALLLPATVDALHQSHRAPAMAPSADLMQALRANGFASVVSGAGPTVMTLADGRRQADQVLEQIHSTVSASAMPDGWRVLELAVDTDGAKVEVHRRN
ncbi:homoserine kinase [Arthrobacter crystallopoietes BAB-32]|uniref:Homoserine kinase n=1 Tax=Arthrobacter crystallopoietes BAB-32 TaxID=1246476 RepID=N1UW88_9MICC|nr:homoserine kinase [Arthrobacter crystallopoietes]EMY33295.1 homoserine kinase [Arthrobacter crystallopoietes BAB-32]